MGKEQRLMLTDSEGSMGGESSGVKQGISFQAHVMLDTSLEQSERFANWGYLRRGVGPKLSCRD